MSFLIDTNILLFAVRETDRLANEVAGILSDISNLIYVSSKSVEEIVLLLRAGRILMPNWKRGRDIFETIENLGLWLIISSGNISLRYLTLFPLPVTTTLLITR